MYMKKSIVKNEESKGKELTQAFVLWAETSKSGKEYLSGVTSEDLGKTRLVGFFNTNKKNPKEPDIRIYNLDKDNNQDKEIADLWANESINKKLYLSGVSDEKEKLVGFYNNTSDTKQPYIRVYFN